MKGKEVICVDDRRTTDESLIPNWPIKDKIYTIRASQNSLAGNGFGYLLEEITNPKLPAIMNGQKIGSFEPGFHCSRFRKLDGTELSITLEKENVHAN